MVVPTEFEAPVPTGACPWRERAPRGGGRFLVPRSDGEVVDCGSECIRVRNLGLTRRSGGR